MKPTKVRNKMIHRAPNALRSLQVGAALSKDLRKKYKKRSVRLTVGDSISIVRGEFAGVDGKVSKVSVDDGTVAIEGIKKEKTKGDKYDVYIHASNVVVTSLSGDDWWRTARLEGKDPKDKSARKEAAAAEEAGDEQDADEQDEAEGREEPEEQDDPKKPDADLKEKGPKEDKKAGQKKQKDKKRAKEADADDDDYEDYEEDDD